LGFQTNTNIVEIPEFAVLKIRSEKIYPGYKRKTEEAPIKSLILATKCHGGREKQINLCSLFYF
jgi:hypothetical protein